MDGLGWSKIVRKLCQEEWIGFGWGDDVERAGMRYERC